MKTTYIRTKCGLGDPATSSDNKLIILVDDETEITVFGYGAGDAKIKVRNVGSGNPYYDPESTLGEVQDRIGAGEPLWGQAVAWAEPLTIAHLVMNVIENQ